jgi:hypothetical protein
VFDKPPAKTATSSVGRARRFASEICEIDRRSTIACAAVNSTRCLRESACMKRSVTCSGIVSRHRSAATSDLPSYGVLRGSSRVAAHGARHWRSGRWLRYVCGGRLEHSYGVTVSARRRSMRRRRWRVTARRHRRTAGLTQAVRRRPSGTARRRRRGNNAFWIRTRAR